MNATQISLFDTINENTAPLFREGQKLYLRELDVVKEITVGGRMWECKHRFKKPACGYYGYETLSGEIILDNMLGDRLFYSEDEALEKAAEKNYEKAYPSEYPLDVTEAAAYSIDGRIAVIAKINSHKLYEKEFACYSFLREYESEKHRDRTYNKLLKKIQKEAQYNGAKPCEPFYDFPMYKVGDVYASFGYALHGLD